MRNQARNQNSSRPSRNDRDPWRVGNPMRILLGPLHFPAHWEYMEGSFDDHDCKTFGPHARSDIQVPSMASVDHILAQLPQGWSPDLILIWRPEYGSLPPDLDQAPVPVVTLTNDWYLAFAECMTAAAFSNATVTGSRGEPVFRRAGVDRVFNLPMLGYQPGVDGVVGKDERDIDVFSATNPSWSIHTQRIQDFGCLLDLPADVKVALRSHLTRAQYNDHLSRSKIFVNRTVIGEINMKIYEVTATQTCLFVEEDNLDVRKYLIPDESVVLFNRENLIEKITYYLAHDEERQAIARRGHEAMQGFSYRANMNRIVLEMQRVGRNELMASGRETARTPARERRLRHLAYSLNRSESDVPELLERAQPTSDDVVEQYLWLLCHANAHTQTERIDLKGVDFIPLPDLVDAFDQLRAKHPDYFPLLYSRAFITQYVDREKALVAHDEAVAGLRRGIDIPLGGSAAYLWETDPCCVLQRSAWEAVERHEDPTEALRPRLIYYVRLNQAKLLLLMERFDDAEQALLQAIDAFAGHLEARRILAQLLTMQRRDDAAIEHWYELLRANPIDGGGHSVLFEVLIRNQRTDQAYELMRRYNRLAKVVGDRKTQTHTGGLLARMHPLVEAVGTSGRR